MNVLTLLLILNKLGVGTYKNTAYNNYIDGWNDYTLRYGNIDERE